MAHYIQTITGRIDPANAGLTLPHEHIMVDFIGADQSGTHRYDRDDVVQKILPVLNEITLLGVKTFIECTPMYLARDVRVLAAVAQATSLQIITNTGQYKEPFLPESTFTSTPEHLAEGWITEFENGIDGTDCKPGFVKTAVNPESLAPAQKTVISAAAITSKATGLPVATHTGVADPANEILDIFESYGVDPDRWIFVHAQNEPSLDKLLGVARRGAWIELDGLRAESQEKHLESLLALLEAGYEEKVMLSHDSGWYRVGEPDGGQINGFTFLFDSFIPRMRESGISDDTIHKICAKNPGRAFSVRA
jgi:phosphotriesterase-related protein